MFQCISNPEVARLRTSAMQFRAGSHGRRGLQWSISSRAPLGMGWSDDLDTCQEIALFILLRFPGSHHGALFSGPADRKKWAEGDYFCPVVSVSVPVLNETHSLKRMNLSGSNEATCCHSKRARHIRRSD